MTDGRSSSISRPNGTRSAAAIAHSVSTLGLPLADFELGERGLAEARGGRELGEREVRLLAQSPDVPGDRADEKVHVSGQSSIPVA